VRHNFIDRYANLDSPLHVLEARTKILGFLSLIAALLLMPGRDDGVLLVYAFVAAILVGASQVPLRYIVGRSLVILPFVLLAGIAAPWTNSFDGARFIALAIRSFLCVTILLLMTSTTPFPELLRGLRKLGCPRILILNLGFLYRYLFVLTEEVLRMRQARDCRRVGRAPLRVELKLLGSMLGALVLRSFERAERMYQAMLSRGYAGEIHVLAPRRFTWRDLTFLAGIALLIVSSFRYTGG